MATDHARRPDGHMDQLVGETIKYVHVTSVKQAVTRLPASAQVLQDVHTRGGTHELLVRDGDDVLILAEVVKQGRRSRFAIGRPGYALLSH
jgi:hypothetical protein